MPEIALAELNAILQTLLQRCINHAVDMANAVAALKAKQVELDTCKTELEQVKAMLAEGEKL